MGQSYGGFMVMSAITEHPDLWRAAVNYYGIADFVTTAGRHRPVAQQPSRGGIRRSADATPQLFARISPIHRVDRVRVPRAGGARQPRPSGADRRERAVRRGACSERQKPVTYLSFDYAGHGFIRPDDRRRIYRAVAEFFRAHL